MRNALRLLCAVACLAFPIAAFGGSYSYPPQVSYSPYPPPPPLFYAPPVVHQTYGNGYYGGYGHGGYGGCGASCYRPPAPTPCCHQAQPSCCGPSRYGHGGGYGYGGGYGQPYLYGSAGISVGFRGHYGHHHHHTRPHHPPRPHHHSGVKPAATPQYAVPAQTAAQAQASQAYAAYYARYYAAYPQHAVPQAPARIAAVPRPKPTGLRGVSKALPPVKPETVAPARKQETAATAKDIDQVAGIPDKRQSQDK